MTDLRQDLPTLGDQAERLIELGVHTIAGLSPERLRTIAAGSTATGPLLVVHPDLAPASSLAPLLRHLVRAGFVVADMHDVDRFTATAEAAPPAGPVYQVSGLDRGDEMAGWTPDQALPAIVAAGRTPLTLCEGIHWLLQRPEVLERGRCFMTIGSRLRKPNGSLDARTPALWISNGTGRDGAHHRSAPKVGWCWAGNSHTWLGFASATGRAPIIAD